MKQIVVGFSKAKSKYALFSKLIMHVQSTPFSHVYIKMPWKAASANLIYQASHTSVNFESETHFLIHAEVVEEFNLEISDESYIKIAKYVMENLNKSYSMAQVFGLLFKFIGLTRSNQFKNGSDAFVCSELINGLLSKADILDTFEYNEEVGPKEVNEFLRNKYTHGKN